MPYLGNTAGNRFVASKAATQFSGDGSTTAFTLDHAVGSDEDILVSVDGVIQEPSVAYAVSNGTTLTFTGAPSNNSGNNIFVYYLFRTVATVDHPSTSSLQATDATFTGAVTANAGVNIDNITIDGTEIDLSSGNLTLDVAGQLIINSDSGQVVLQDDTVNWGNLQNSSGDFIIGSLGADKDIIFQGLDGSSTIEAMRIDVSEGGKIGIGTNSPSEKLEINTGTGNIGAKIVSTDSLALMAFKDDSTSDVVLAGASGDNFAVSHDILFTNSSKGVYLGVTSATASNLLDDYEEGTFTPTVYDSGGNTMSLSTSQGYYTKIGRTVHFNFYIVLASSGNTFAGNQVYIGGLPFTASNATNNVNMQQIVRSNVDSTSGYSEVISYIAPNTNYSQLLHGGDNIAFDNFRGTALNNSCQFQQVGHYFVA